jgi:hypothetical protein
MINEEKIRSMTKAAVYEGGTQKQNIEICRYFKSDYVGLQLIKSAFAYLLALCAVLLLWFMSDREAILLKLSQPAYLQDLFKTVGILGGSGLVIYEIVVYFYYTRKYHRATESVNLFQKNLKEVEKFYETEESAEDYTIIDLSDEEKDL